MNPGFAREGEMLIVVLKQVTWNQWSAAKHGHWTTSIKVCGPAGTSRSRF